MRLELDVIKDLVKSVAGVVGTAGGTAVGVAAGTAAALAGKPAARDAVRAGFERPAWGCLVALAYALEYPWNSASVVLASGYYYPTARPDALLLAPPGMPVVGDILRYTVSPLVGRLLWPAWLRLLFSPLSVPDYFSRFPMWMALRPGQLRAVGEESAMLALVTARMQREYKKLRAPAVIVAGDRDRYVSTERHSQRLHKSLPGSAFITVTGAGHMAHHAAPGVFMEAIATAEMLQKAALA